MQKREQKRTQKSFPFFLMLAIAPIIAFALLVPTIDAEKYRPHVAALLADSLGRKVTLNGPISFAMGWEGITITAHDAAITNPEPSPRPEMAHIGKLVLGMDTPLLFRNQLPIRDLTLENADILFETHAPPDPAPAPETKAWTLFPALRLSLKLHSVKITDSRLAFLKSDGTLAALNVSSLALEMTKEGAVLNLRGEASGKPLVADIKTTMKDIVSPEPFAIDAAGTYGAFYLGALGNVHPAEGRVELSAYELSSGNTKLTGAIDATWASARPILHGTINSEQLNLSDLLAERTPEPDAQSAQGPVFSTKPFPVDAFRNVDADIALNIARIPFGKGELTHIQARLTLLKGNLTLAPVKAQLGNTPIDMRTVFDTSRSPAQFDFGMIAHNVDFGDLQRLAGIPPFMSGKAGAFIRLGGSGDTPHNIAASLAGVISVSAENGTILAGILSESSSLLTSVFTSGGNNTALNCLAARFIVKNGIMSDNGILIDSPISTISGTGEIDLGAEVMELSLKARPKVAGIAGLIPILQVAGPIKTPAYSVNARTIVKHVVNSLIDAGGYGVEAVPVIEGIPAGENACVYTLDHPKKRPTTSVVRTDPLGKIENIGKSLIGGLFSE